MTLSYATAKRILETGGLRAVDYALASAIGDGDHTNRPVFEEAACIVADFERAVEATQAMLHLYRLWHDGHTYRELARFSGMSLGGVYKKVNFFVKKVNKTPLSRPTRVTGDVFNETDSARSPDDG